MKKTISIFLFFALLSMTYSCSQKRLATTQYNYGGSEILYQYKWNFTELNSQPISTGRDTAYLLFYPGQVNRVTGSTGCNRLTGTFELSGTNKMMFSQLVTTRMACSDYDELPVLTALKQVNNWSIINDQLLLSHGKILVAKLQGVPVAVPK